MQAADEPPYLTVGTDVSAKYKGAFCEAKIKKVNRFVKCKITFKNNQGTAVVSDDQVRGTLRVGAHVEAKHPEKNQYIDALIAKLFDYSQYTVVFDDGDETTLRRSSLCLKSGRHFAESESLDQLPLTNPEHFGTPVIGSKSRRKRRSAALNIAIDDDSSEDEGISKRFKENKQKHPDFGKVVCLEHGDKRKKDQWFPALVVSPSAQEGFKINPKEEYLVRSFKDGKYYQVLKKETKSFVKEMVSKLDNASLKAAVEKAQLFLEQNELPPHWDLDLLMGINVPSAEEDSHDSDSDTSDDEPSEEKDRFVAQLYKFMDERGTPINKAPTVGNRDLNLYKLFKVVQKMGGYNRVTNQNQWKIVFTRMGLPNSTHSSLQQLKQAHKKYLHSFEDFFRKLGCTMVTNTRSNRVRHRSDRNLIMTRNRDRDLSVSRARLQMRESKEKQKKEEKATKVESEKEEEKVRTTPRTRTSCRDQEGETTKDAEARLKEAGCSDNKNEGSEKKEKRQSIKQEVELEEKKTYKRVESEDDTGSDKSKDRAPKQAEKNKKKVKEKKEKSVVETTKKKSKLSVPKEEDEKASVSRVAQSEKPKKKRMERIKKEPIVESDTSGDKKDGSNSDSEDGKMESTDSDKKGKDVAIRKQVKKKMKPMEMDFDDYENRESEDEKDSDINEQACSCIEIGDKLKVKYGRGKQLKIYEAKVIKVEENCIKPYFVHYTGWNVRYDEWIRRSRIVDNTTKSQAKKKKASALKAAASSKLPNKRSRSNSISPMMQTQAIRKPSTSSSQQSSRHTRSEKSNLFSGLEPRKRVRRKSGVPSTDLQASDNESGETSDACDSLDKSIDKTGGDSIQDLLEQSESLPDEEEDEDDEEKPNVKAEPTGEKQRLEIKAEAVEDEIAEGHPDSGAYSMSPSYQKQEASMVVKEECGRENPMSPVGEIPSLLAENGNSQIKSERKEGMHLGIVLAHTEEETPLIISNSLEGESKNMLDESLHENSIEDTENEDDTLDGSFDKLEEEKSDKKEPEVQNYESKKDLGNAPLLIDSIGMTEESSEGVTNSPKESDMCSFVSKLEEIEQCADSKANIQKLINDLESPESSDTSPNDSESDIPKYIDDDLMVKKPLEFKVILSSTNEDADSPPDVSSSINEQLSSDSTRDCEYQKLQCDTKKEGKKKKAKVLKAEKKTDPEDELKGDNRLKTKKRQKHEDQEEDGKHKNKKLKKNKGKKKAEAESSSEVEKKTVEGDRVKKKEKKRKEDRKPFAFEAAKSGDGAKKEKRKGKKSKEKLVEKADVFGEKKLKKKRKGHSESPLDFDSDRGPEPEKHLKTLKKKRGKKSKAKEEIDSKIASPVTKKDRKLKLELLDIASVSRQQPEDHDNPDKHLLFLLCEEKVPASPVGDTSPDNDDSSGSKPTAGPFVESDTGNYSGFSPSCLAKTVEKHEEVATVLDNTPPTTPESTDSGLIGTPQHEPSNTCVRGIDFCTREPSSVIYLHESQKGENLESEDSAESTLSSQSGSDNDRHESNKTFFKRQNLETEAPKKLKRSKRSSTDCSTLHSKQKMIAKVKGLESKDSLMKTVESSDSDGSQHLSSSSLFTPSMMGLGHVSTVSMVQSNRPSKFNFFVPLDDYTDADKRITIIQEKLSELRKVYMGLKAEVALIDRRRKRAKKKEKEAGNCTSNNNNNISSHGTEQQAVHHPS